MKNENIVMDERAEQVSLKAVRVAYFVLLLYVVGSMVYRLVTQGAWWWDLGALLVSTAALLIYNRAKGDLDVPRDFLGRVMTVGTDKASRQKRRKTYLADSFCFALFMTVMDLAFDKESLLELGSLFPDIDPILAMAVSLSFSFALSFGICYALDYALGEREVRKYNKLCAQLDQEENDLN